MTQASWFLELPRPAGCASRLALLAAGALLLVACGGTNDPDKNGTGGSGASAGTSGSGGTGSISCTVTAAPSPLLAIPAGEFSMGCNEATDAACDDDEKPQHTVSMSAYSIDRTEVSQAQYTACMLDGACEPPLCDWNCERGDYPAGCVTSTHAQAYCSWAGRRLPTEAEWEKAARGADGATFPWGDDEPSCELANKSGCSDGAMPVGSMSSGASPYGVLDMAGNVVEMVADWYDETYYAASPAGDPEGPDSGSRYVGRGGGYKSETKWLRASKRDWYDVEDSAVSLGFRCAK